MFEKLKNKDKAFYEVRRISMVAIMASALVCIITQAYHYAKVKRLESQINLLEDGKVMQDNIATGKAHITAETIAQIKNFHRYFFYIDPDATHRYNDILRAMYWADDSAKKAFNHQSQQGYYTRLINGNISYRITIDSIRLDLSQSPYGFRCYFTQNQCKTGNTVTKSLISEGKLRSTSRGEQNLHGFLIENWNIVKNGNFQNSIQQAIIKHSY